MRASEIVSLTWSCYDPEKRKIYIKTAVVLDENRNKVRKKTKTVESKRNFAIPKALTDKLVVGDCDEPIVKVSMDTVRDKLHAVCKKNNIPDIRLHDLRHINASVMLYLGIPNKINNFFDSLV